MIIICMLTTRFRLEKHFKTWRECLGETGEGLMEHPEGMQPGKMKNLIGISFSKPTA